MTLPNQWGDGSVGRHAGDIAAHQRFPALLKAYDAFSRSQTPGPPADALSDAALQRAVQRAVQSFGKPKNRAIVDQDDELDAVMERTISCLQEKAAVLQRLSVEEKEVFAVFAADTGDASLWDRMGLPKPADCRRCGADGGVDGGSEGIGIGDGNDGDTTAAAPAGGGGGSGAAVGGNRDGDGDDDMNGDEDGENGDDTGSVGR
ncbi:unnamed protein product [Phaeothamnion confervicola]